MCFSAMIAKVTGQELIKSEFLDIKNIKTIEYPENSKGPEEDKRFYPKTWAPLLVRGKEGFQLRPMRYQLLPSFCEDNKYTRLNPKTGRQVEIKNTFNARIDSLEERKAWQPLFGKRHGAICLQSFYEWVDRNGSKALIEFRPDNKENFWVACLWDRWQKGAEYIDSFAMITDEPNPEVLEKGHDRTPLILKEEHLKDWLEPEVETKSELYELLGDKKPVYFDGTFYG